jgi:hypothetical protein
MNIGMLLMIFAFAIAAVIGIAYIASSHSEVVVDSYNNTQGNAANLSQNATVQLTTAGSKVGGAGVLLIAGLIGVVVLLGFYALAKSRSGGRVGRGG